MEAGAAQAESGGLKWRLWALAPILLLAIVVGAFTQSGSSLVDLINSFHLHADFFRYQPTGTGDNWEYTDIVMQCQGQRGVIEIDFANTGTFMFHAHQSEFTELGWMGFFEVVD